MRSVFSLLLMAKVFVLTNASTIAAEAIAWAPDVQTAQQVAAQENRMVLLHFWAPDCPPCHSVEENVFSRPSVAQTMRENFVPVKVNAAEKPALKLQYNVERWPTDVITTADGKIIHRMVSPQDPRKYVYELSAVAMMQVSNQQRQQNTGSPWNNLPSQSQPFAQNRNNANPFNQQGAATSATGAGYSRAGFSGYPSFGNQATQTGEQERPDRSQQPESQRRQVINHYAGYQSNQQPSANEFPRNGLASHYTPAGAGRPGLVQQQRTDVGQDPRSSSWASTTLNVDNPYAAASHTTASVSRDVTPTAQPEPSQGFTPQALNGHCPVTLCTQQKWKKGDARWGAVHRGRTYLFAGSQEQREFLADPDLYSPMLSGIDAVRLANQGQIIEGKRQHGVVYGERIYLFDSEDTLNTFWRAPERYAAPIRQAMSTGDLGTLLR